MCPGFGAAAKKVRHVKVKAETAAYAAPAPSNLLDTPNGSPTFEDSIEVCVGTLAAICKYAFSAWTMHKSAIYAHLFRCLRQLDLHISALAGH